MRLLTARQQRALDELIDLGANLRGDFTVGDLRKAFRALARLYHPDRHPTSSDVEKARLCRLFAGVSDNYQRLLAVLEPPTSTRH